MACQSCYAKHVNKATHEVNWSPDASSKLVMCSVCGGTGYIVPNVVNVTAGLLGGSITYPKCNHCKGEGRCGVVLLMSGW